MAGKRPQFKQGFYPVRNPSKYVGDVNGIVWRSSWELRFMRWCDAHPNVLKWASEELIVPYFSAIDQKQHRYFVDFVVTIRNKAGVDTTYLVEIKPHEQTQPPKPSRSRHYQAKCLEYVKNQEKWKAADAWARSHGMKFIVMTEYELGMRKRKNG